MTYEDLINISDPYKVYIKFKETYPCDSEIRISTRKNKKYMIYNTEKEKWFHLEVVTTLIFQNMVIQPDKLFI